MNKFEKYLNEGTKIEDYPSFIEEAANNYKKELNDYLKALKKSDDTDANKKAKGVEKIIKDFKKLEMKLVDYYPKR